MDPSQWNIDYRFKLQLIITFTSVISCPPPHPSGNMERVVTRRRKASSKSRRAPSCSDVVCIPFSRKALIADLGGLETLSTFLHAKSSMRKEIPLWSKPFGACGQRKGRRQRSRKGRFRDKCGYLEDVARRDVILAGNLLTICATEALGVEAVHLAKPVSIQSSAVLAPEGFRRRRLAVLLIFLRVSLHFTSLYCKRGSAFEYIARIFKHRGCAAMEGLGFGKHLDVCSFTRVNSESHRISITGGRLFF